MSNEDNKQNTTNENTYNVSRATFSAKPERGFCEHCLEYLAIDKRGHCSRCNQPTSAAKTEILLLAQTYLQQLAGFPVSVNQVLVIPRQIDENRNKPAPRANGYCENCKSWVSLGYFGKCVNCGLQSETKFPTHEATPPEPSKIGYLGNIAPGGNILEYEPEKTKLTYFDLNILKDLADKFLKKRGRTPPANSLDRARWLCRIDEIAQFAAEQINEMLGEEYIAATPVFKLELSLQFIIRKARSAADETGQTQYIFAGAGFFKFSNNINEWQTIPGALPVATVEPTSDTPPDLVFCGRCREPLTYESDICLNKECQFSNNATTNADEPLTEDQTKPARQFDRQTTLFVRPLLDVIRDAQTTANKFDLRQFIYIKGGILRHSAAEPKTQYGEFCLMEILPKSAAPVEMPDVPLDLALKIANPKIKATDDDGADLSSVMQQFKDETTRIFEAARNMSKYYDFPGLAADAITNLVVGEIARFCGFYDEFLEIDETRAPDFSELLPDVPPGMLKPVDMVLHCPHCRRQHIDAPEPENDWTNPPHKSHKCHYCGIIFRPADVPTNGVEEIKTSGKNDTDLAEITKLNISGGISKGFSVVNMAEFWPYFKELERVLDVCKSYVPASGYEKMRGYLVKLANFVSKTPGDLLQALPETDEKPANDKMILDLELRGTKKAEKILSNILQTAENLDSKISALIGRVKQFEGVANRSRLVNMTNPLTADAIKAFSDRADEKPANVSDLPENAPVAVIVHPKNACCLSCVVILGFIATNDGWTARELALQTNYSKKTTNAHLDELLRQNKIVETDNGFYLNEPKPEPADICGNCGKKYGNIYLLNDKFPDHKDKRFCSTYCRETFKQRFEPDAPADKPENEKTLADEPGDDEPDEMQDCAECKSLLPDDKTQIRWFIGLPFGSLECVEAYEKRHFKQNPK